MSKPKHTPGPWIYDGKSRDVVRNSNGTLVAQLYKIHAESLEADAHLIAAAPELLELVTALLNSERRNGVYRNEELISRAERVISKAEGSSK